MKKSVFSNFKQIDKIKKSDQKFLQWFLANIYWKLSFLWLRVRETGSKTLYGKCFFPHTLRIVKCIFFIGKEVENFFSAHHHHHHNRAGVRRLRARVHRITSIVNIISTSSYIRVFIHSLELKPNGRARYCSKKQSG